MSLCLSVSCSDDVVKVHRRVIRNQGCVSSHLNPWTSSSVAKRLMAFFIVFFQNTVREWVTSQWSASCHPTVMCHRCGTKAKCNHTQHHNHTHDANILALKYAGRSLKHIVRDGTNRILSVSLRVCMSHGARLKTGCM